MSKPSAYETAAVNAAMNDDALRDAIGTKDAKTVIKILKTYGITFSDDSKASDIINNKVDWSKLNDLEALLGRQPDGKIHPRMA